MSKQSDSQFPDLQKLVEEAEQHYGLSRAEIMPPKDSVQLELAVILEEFNNKIGAINITQENAGRIREISTLMDKVLINQKNNLYIIAMSCLGLNYTDQTPIFEAITKSEAVFLATRNVLHSIKSFPELPNNAPPSALVNGHRILTSTLKSTLSSYEKLINEVQKSNGKNLDNIDGIVKLFAEFVKDHGSNCVNVIQFYDLNTAKITETKKQIKSYLSSIVKRHDSITKSSRVIKESLAKCNEVQGVKEEVMPALEEKPNKTHNPQLAALRTLLLELQTNYGESNVCVNYSEKFRALENLVGPISDLLTVCKITQDNILEIGPVINAINHVLRYQTFDMHFAAMELVAAADQTVNKPQLEGRSKFERIDNYAEFTQLLGLFGQLNTKSRNSKNKPLPIDLQKLIAIKNNSDPEESKIATFTEQFVDFINSPEFNKKYGTEGWAKSFAARHVALKKLVFVVDRKLTEMNIVNLQSLVGGLAGNVDTVSKKDTIKDKNEMLHSIKKTFDAVVDGIEIDNTNIADIEGMLKVMRQDLSAQKSSSDNNVLASVQKLFEAMNNSNGQKSSVSGGVDHSQTNFLNNNIKITQKDAIGIYVFMSTKKKDGVGNSSGVIPNITEAEIENANNYLSRIMVANTLEESLVKFEKRIVEQKNAYANPRGSLVQEKIGNIEKMEELGCLIEKAKKDLDEIEKIDGSKERLNLSGVENQLINIATKIRNLLTHPVSLQDKKSIEKLASELNSRVSAITLLASESNAKMEIQEQQLQKQKQAEKLQQEKDRQLIQKELSQIEKHPLVQAIYDPEGIYRDAIEKVIKEVYRPFLGKADKLINQLAELELRLLIDKPNSDLEERIKSKITEGEFEKRKGDLNLSLDGFRTFKKNILNCTEEFAELIMKGNAGKLFENVLSIKIKAEVIKQIKEHPLIKIISPKIDNIKSIIEVVYKGDDQKTYIGALNTLSRTNFNSTPTKDLIDALGRIECFFLEAVTKAEEVDKNTSHELIRTSGDITNDSLRNMSPYFKKCLNVLHQYRLSESSIPLPDLEAGKLTRSESFQDVHEKNRSSESSTPLLNLEAQELVRAKSFNDIKGQLTSQNKNRTGILLFPEVGRVPLPSPYGATTTAAASSAGQKI